MTLSRPRAVLTVDGQERTGPEAALVRLTVSLALGGRHDRVTALLWPDSRLATLSPGDPLSVSIGEEGEEIQIFTGEVGFCASTPVGVEVEGLAATCALSRIFLARTWLGQTVADVVKELAGEAAVDEVEAPLLLDAYTVDSRRPAWAWLTDLAELVDADLGASPDGGLRFLPVRKGSADFTLRYGADLLAWEVVKTRSLPRPGVATYGAASEAGAEKWHWLVREPGPSGGGEGPFRVHAALRNRDAADLVGRGLLARTAREELAGSLRLVGNPSLRPGDLVDLADVPGVSPGTLRAVEIEHVYDAMEGFITTVTVESAGGAGP